MDKNILIASYHYDYINPTEKTNSSWAFVPGFRGVDQMCIYTFDYENKTVDNLTGTNPWGFEAAVDYNGIVVELNDRVKIPEGGYVISGNSKANDFIVANIKVGSCVKLNKENKTIIVTTDILKTTLFNLQRKLEYARNRYQTALNKMFLFNNKKTEEKVEQIASLNKLAKESKSLANIKKISKKIESLCDEVFAMTTKVSLIRSCGLWSRPAEKNLEEIIDLLETMKRNNFNVLYVESFYNGDVAGKSKYTNTVKEIRDGNYGVYGDDYLLALISEGHKRNIEIHAWVENFFVGEDLSCDKDYPSHFRMVNYDGSVIQGPGIYNTEVPENNFIFLDPAHPETHRYVLAIYEEMLNKYDFDGFNIDYIRYPHGNYDLKTSNGYSEYAMNEFKEIYGFSKNDDVRKLVEEENNLKLWVEYRCSKITLLMKEIRQLIDRIKPSCLISMAVVPETDYAIKNKMQDWVLWVKNGWIDITLPMAYYFGSSEVENATRNLVAFNGNKAFSYSGISPSFSGALNHNANIQIDAVYNNNAQGFAIFQINNLQMMPKSKQKILNKGVLRVTTVQPHAKPSVVINAFIEEIKLKYDLYIAGTEHESLYINIIAKLYGILKYSKEKPTDYLYFLNEINRIKETIHVYRYDNIKNVLSEDFSYLENILTIQGRKYL